jgi:hypothetical protein
MYGTVKEFCEWRLFITVLGDTETDGRKQLVNVALEDGRIYGLGQQTLYNGLWHGSGENGRGQLWERRVKEQRIISTYKAIKMLFVTMSVYVYVFEPVRWNCILYRRYSNMFCTNSCFPLNIPILHSNPNLPPKSWYKQPKNYIGLTKGWMMIQTWWSQGGLWYLWRYKGFYKQVTYGAPVWST